MTQAFEDTEKYGEILSRIDENYTIMRNMRPLPSAGVERYQEEFSISTSHNSNAIEGNTFTYDETRLLLKEGVVSNVRSFREHAEISDYKSAFDFLYVALKNDAPITEDFVKKIHGMVYRRDETSGQYRTIQNEIGDMFNPKPTFVPCLPEAVPGKMSEYVERLQADIRENQKIKQGVKPDWAGVFRNLATHHIAFERIHPFVDGNGRTGRLLLTYEMISCGLLPVDIRYEERTRYYAAFKDYDIKSKYSTKQSSKADKMAKLLAESELRSMDVWNKMFAAYVPASPQLDKMRAAAAAREANTVVSSAKDDVHEDD